MTPPHLMNVPREQWATTIADALIELYQLIFPGRLRSVYLIGSQIEGSAASVSDIDGCILFKTAFIDDSEMQLAQAVLTHCQHISPLRLDFSVWAEDDERFRTGVDVRLKLGSELVFGEDIRDQLPLPTIEAYQAYMRNWVQVFLVNLHDLKELSFPLVYPVPEDEFFGYTRKRAMPWYPPDVESGTKELVATVCWVATAMLAHEAEAFVATRSECIALCQKHLPKDPADFVTAVYEHCKIRWDYKVPMREEERTKLRELCRQALAFFNEYVDAFAAWVR